MVWFWQHGNELFILFLFPLIGLVIDLWVPKKITNYTLIISGILCLPIFTGYSYLIPWLYQIFGLIFLSVLYALYSNEIGKLSPKIISSAVIAGLLFIILGWFSFMDSFSGYQKVVHSWKTSNYKIEYIKDQGFAGSPLMKYELSEYAVIPIFIKKIETVRRNDSADKCIITFPMNKLKFNKCKGSISKIP